MPGRTTRSGTPLGIPCVSAGFGTPRPCMNPRHGERTGSAEEWRLQHLALGPGGGTAGGVPDRARDGSTGRRWRTRRQGGGGRQPRAGRKRSGREGVQIRGRLSGGLAEVRRPDRCRRDFIRRHDAGPEDRRHASAERTRLRMRLRDGPHRWLCQEGSQLPAQPAHRQAGRRDGQAGQASVGSAGVHRRRESQEGSGRGRAGPRPGAQEGRDSHPQSATGDQARQGHDCGVQRLSVPVLWPRDPHREGDPAEVPPRRGAGLREPAVAVSRPRQGWRQGVSGGQQARQGLGASRQDVRQSTGPHAARPREVREGGWAERRQVEEGHGRSGDREAVGRRPGAGQLPGREWNADVLHQRTRAVGGTTLWVVSDRHRRGDQEGRRPAEGRYEAGRPLRDDHGQERRRGACPRRRRHRRPQPARSRSTWARRPSRDPGRPRSPW